MPFNRRSLVTGICLLSVQVSDIVRFDYVSYLMQWFNVFNRLGDRLETRWKIDLIQ